MPYDRDELATLDTLPAHAAMDMEMHHLVDEYRVIVRFRASRRRWRFWWQKSEWSGWFDWTGQPIVLTWRSFWE